MRTSDAAALQRGEFTVIELNGLTSETTSIYDPRHNIFHGWRVLCRQWSDAWRIARVNRALGIQPYSLVATWRLLQTAGTDP